MIYSITNFFIFLFDKTGTDMYICNCKKNNRLTPMHIAAHMDISAGLDSNIEHEYC